MATRAWSETSVSRIIGNLMMGIKRFDHETKVKAWSKR